MEKKLELQKMVIDAVLTQHAFIERGMIASNAKITRYRLSLKVHNLSQIEALTKGLRNINGIKKVRRL